MEKRVTKATTAIAKRVLESKIPYSWLEDIPKHVRNLVDLTGNSDDRILLWDRQLLFTTVATPKRMLVPTFMHELSRR